MMPFPFRKSLLRAALTALSFALAPNLYAGLGTLRQVIDDPTYDPDPEKRAPFGGGKIIIEDDSLVIGKHIDSTGYVYDLNRLADGLQDIINLPSISFHETELAYTTSGKLQFSVVRASSPQSNGRCRTLTGVRNKLL